MDEFLFLKLLAEKEEIILQPQKANLVDQDYATKKSGLCIQMDADHLRGSYQWFSRKWYSLYLPWVYYLPVAIILCWIINKYVVVDLFEKFFSNKALVFIMLSIGIWNAYKLLALFFNRTLLVATNEEILVCHKPFPTYGNRAMPCKGIVQFYTELIVKRPLPILILTGASSPPFEIKISPVSFYQLNEMYSDKWVKGILIGSEYEVVHYLEMMLEKFLGLQDKLVTGEVEGVSQENNLKIESVLLDEAVKNKYGDI